MNKKQILMKFLFLFNLSVKAINKQFSYRLLDKYSEKFEKKNFFYFKLHRKTFDKLQAFLLSFLQIPSTLLSLKTTFLIL